MGVSLEKKDNEYIHPHSGFQNGTNVRVVLGDGEPNLTNADRSFLEEIAKEADAARAKAEEHTLLAEEAFLEAYEEHLASITAGKQIRLDVPTSLTRLHSMFLPSEHRESALGDREEIFRKDATKDGRSWAVWLYCWDTFVAMCSWMKKVASFSAIAGLGGAVLKWLGAGG